VVARDGFPLTEEAVRAHCRRLIAGCKCPRSVEIRAEPLPLSGAGRLFAPATSEGVFAPRLLRASG
jgi:long-chain acyl-CoA synthetase